MEKPFAMALDVDLRRDDHKNHKKQFLSPALRKQERENKKILEQLAKINWLKNKIMLDLSELIRKHEDRQPELLALL